MFNVGADGTLTQDATATIGSPAGTSAAQVLASPDGTLLFTNDFFAPNLAPPGGSLRTFHINPTGAPTQIGAAVTVPPAVPMGVPPMFAPVFSLTQGVQVHPTQRIFYACSPANSHINVFTYDANGQLSFNSFATASGVAACWLVINSNATRMYTVCTADNSVSVFNISNPLAPVEIQNLKLKDGAPTFPAPLPFLPPFTSSGGTEEALDPSGTHLYVVASRLNPDPAYTGGDFLHVLTVAADGTLSEPGPSVGLNQSGRSHPQGLVAL